MSEKQNLKDLPGKEEQCCGNCEHGEFDLDGEFICYQACQIHTFVHPNDYCIYHERKENKQRTA